MATRTALIQNGVVQSVVMAGTGYTAPAGMTAVATDTANIGDAYNGTTFTPAVPEVVTPIAQQLATYASAKQAKIMTSGISVNVAASGQAANNIEASTDTASLVLLQGAALQAQANAAATFNWVSNGAAVTLTSAQMLTILSAVTTFLQATFTTLAQVLYAVNAGTITTTAEVDTPPSPISAWPVNS